MTTLEKVEFYLRTEPRTRDNDKLLAMYIHLKEDPDLSNSSFLEYAKKYALSNNYTNHDTITRARRKLQEENPSLRGRTYNMRHDKKEEIRKDVNTLFK